MKQQNKKKEPHWLTIASIVLIFIISLVLILNKPIQNMMIVKGSNQYQLENVSKKKIQQNEKAKTNFNFSSVRSVNFQSVLSSKLDSQQLPVVGEIAIPDLKINLPIFKGVGNSSLLYGAGTMKENEKMGEGNYALAGHNMTGFSSDLSILFTPLKRAKPGMVIYVTDKENIYKYKINKIRKVKPNHVEVINDIPGKTEITLVTCADIKATQRIIVKGTYEGKESFKRATLEVKNAFERKYNQMSNL
ncbi:class A sortase [Enterococcus lactis]|uniref:class A sortase n=1 Tax=Enterococcus lactis TaxID=357441 RepID=UPI0034E974FD